MIDHTAVIGQFKGRVLHAYGLIYAAWLAVSDFMVDMFHAENIAKLGYRWQPSTSSHQFDFLEATLGSFGPADMFAVDRHLWVRWSIEDGEVRFDCRYYKERLGRVEETGALILKTMKAFVEGLQLKGDPKSHVGFPVTRLDRSHYLPYLLDMGSCPDW